MKRILHKHHLKKIIRSLIFTFCFAAAGMLYAYLAECSSGTCAVGPEPISFMLYTGIVGFIVSFLVGKECDKCNT